MHLLQRPRTTELTKPSMIPLTMMQMVNWTMKGVTPRTIPPAIRRTTRLSLQTTHRKNQLTMATTPPPILQQTMVPWTTVRRTALRVTMVPLKTRHLMTPAGMQRAILLMIQLETLPTTEKRTVMMIQMTVPQTTGTTLRRTTVPRTTPPLMTPAMIQQAIQLMTQLATLPTMEK